MGDFEEVASLLHQKQDPNEQDSDKRSPLHAAAFKGDCRIAEALILSGARVNSKDNRWLTPLHRACCSNSEVGCICYTVHLILLKYVISLHVYYEVKRIVFE